MPNLPLKIVSAALKHSSFELGIKTPLPEARPSAFTTIGIDDELMIFLASSRELTFQKFAVGIFASCINSFAQDLLNSNFAPSLLGPNTLKSFWRRKSANPFARGISGPITTKSILRESSFSKSSFLLFISIFILSHLFILSEPALPGIK